MSRTGFGGGLRYVHEGLRPSFYEVSSSCEWGSTAMILILIHNIAQKIIEYIFHYRNQLFSEVISIAKIRRNDDALSGDISDETSISTDQYGVGSRHQHYEFCNGLLELIDHPPRLPYEISAEYLFVVVDYEEQVDMSEWSVNVKTGQLSQKSPSEGKRVKGKLSATKASTQRRDGSPESEANTQKRRRSRDSNSEDSPTTPEHNLPHAPPLGRLLVADTPSPPSAAQIDLPLQLRQTKAALEALEAEFEEQQDVAYEAREEFRYGLRDNEKALRAEFQEREDEWKKEILALKEEIERLVQRNRLLESSDMEALAKAVGRRERSESTESIEES